MNEQKLTSKDELTNLIKDKGIKTWEEAIEFVRCLPYGRNSNRTDFKLVISEQKGSCSSKHAMLKKLADINDIPKIKLILGMYRMNETNTPKIGNVLTENNLEFIPEAHCYLNIDRKSIDITTSESNFNKLEHYIIEELEIQPEQVADFKVNYHKEFIKNWIKETKSELEFSQLWNIREKCIENLTQ